MNENLQGNLDFFKKYTIQMISYLKEDDMDNFEIALAKRTEVMEKINDLEFNKSEFKEICEELKIINLNNELNETINQERALIKEKILELKKTQSINNVYHSKLGMSSVFSKKV